MTKGEAAGKVILLGEHAVVYGVPALAVGISRGAWAQLREGEPFEASLEVPDWNLRVTTTGDHEAPLARAFGALLEATRADGVSRVDVAVVAGTELPPGGGLGCSAALGVAVARALDPSASSDVIATRVRAWEDVFHGNSSGIDAVVAARGGCLLFQRHEDGRRIEPLAVPRPIHLCVGNTGEASSTRSMVDAVARYRERRPELAARAFDGIHTLVKNARLAIEDSDMKALGQLMDLNQMLLSGLFVSTPEIEQMCARARERGAFGAKLTGAGGGGSVIALVAGVAEGESVLEGWRADGFQGFIATVGADAARARVVARIPLGKPA